MKNLKKMLSVIVVIAMLATTMLPAFAADTAAAPKTEADIVKALGVVIGGEDGITDEYLQATTLRYQSAIIFLRLIGLEADAREYAGEDNFADANTVSADTKKYLGYLKTHPEYGWIGIGNNMFDPNSATSAQAFYKVLLETLGYKCTVGDVQGDFDYANTIAFAAEKGLAKVANVDKFTNADLITAVLEVLPLEKKGTGKTLLKTLVEAGVINEEIAKEYLPDALELTKTVTTEVYSVAATNGQLTVVLTEDVGATPAASDFTITQAINGGAATTVTGTVYSYTYETKTVVIDVPVVAEASEEQNVVYSVQYKDTTAVAAPAIVVGAAFGIKDIVEPSLKLIKVNLNKDYDSSKDTFTVYKTSDTSATVAISAVGVTGNAKQVIVKATGTFEADVDYTLKLTRDGKDYTKAFKIAADTSVPQLLKAEAIGNRIIRVTFSEPVQNADALNGSSYNFRIGDAVINGSTVDFDPLTHTDSASVKYLDKKLDEPTEDDIVVSDDLTTVDFTLKNALATGEYTLAILKNGTNIKDFAGYEVPLTSTKFTVSLSDKVAQADKLTVNSRSEVVVEFTGAISAPSTSVVFWNTDGSDSNSYKTASKVVKTSDTKYTFSFTSNVIPTGKVYFFVKGVVDAYGNAVPTKKFEVEVGADPVATATINVVDEDTVEIKFSKDMQNDAATGGAKNTSHYVVKKSDGSTVSISSIEYDSKVTKIHLSSKQSGDCTISVSGVKDLVGQEMTPISNQTIKFTDVTAPTLASSDPVKINGASDVTKIYVEFSEEMATSGAYSVLTIGNYKWSYDGVVSYEAFPDGTTVAISADNKNAVVITIPGTSTKKASTATTIKIGEVSGATVKAVADKAGNLMIPGTISPTAVDVSSANPTIDGQELKITSGNTLQVKVSGRLEKVAASDFQYTTNGSVYVSTIQSAKLVDIDGAQWIEFAVPADTFSSNTVMANVVVKAVSAAGTTNVLGVGIATGTSAAASSTSFKTSIKSVAIYDTNNIIVKLDGNVKAGDLSEFVANIKLTQGTTAIGLQNPALIGSATQSNVIKVETTTALDLSAEVTLKTLPDGFITAKDANGQYIVANSTDGVKGTTAFIAGAAAITTGSATSEVADNDKITITFNMVPKEVSTASVVADEAGKVKVVINGVGTITGFTSADSTALTGAAASVAINGKTIVVTLSAADTEANFVFGAAGDMKFTPESALTSGGKTIDTDVKPIF